ncbi:EI24 domain-containing protein [Rathayibacter sp. YIM 133350]|uniref:EI24 domain-containing protein n=1 Tax=Rathayibacter sp. YIM 133350 TaxID=3131992 RepID=UPI00307D059C
MLRGFATGIGMLARGFGFWGRRPGVMLLGLVPAAIVFVLIVAALVALGLNVVPLVDAITPFADGWPEFWATGLRVLTGALLFGVVIVLAAVTFTALTLAIGDPFYERIWRAVELELGGEVPVAGAGLWRSIRDGAVLIGLGIVTAIGVGIIGFIPVVGSIAAPVLGVVLSGRLLAIELTSRAFEARGMSSAQRKAVLRSRRGQVLGFGVATQLLFLIPLGAVFTMPAAVAGSTMLARGALDAVPTPR